MPSNWTVRDVPEETKRAIKMYAAKNGITIAEALGRLVNTGTKGNPTFLGQPLTAEQEKSFWEGNL